MNNHNTCILVLEEREMGLKITLLYNLAWLHVKQRERERKKERESLVLIELTIIYETNFDDAAERKEVKYEELITGARTSGYDAVLITLEVGFRGVINPAGFKHLRQTLNICSTEMSELLLCTCKRAIKGSGAVGTE